MSKSNKVLERKFEVDVYKMRDVLDSYGYTGLDRYVDDNVRRIWKTKAATPIDAIGHVITGLAKYRKLSAPRWAQARISDISEENEFVINSIVKEITPLYPQQLRLL